MPYLVLPSFAYTCTRFDHVYCEPCITISVKVRNLTLHNPAIHHVVLYMYICVEWLVRIFTVLSIEAPPIHSHQHYGDRIVLQNALGKLARTAAMAIPRWRWGRSCWMETRSAFGSRPGTMSPTQLWTRFCSMLTPVLLNWTTSGWNGMGSQDWLCMEQRLF